MVLLLLRFPKRPGRDHRVCPRNMTTLAPTPRQPVHWAGRRVWWLPGIMMSPVPQMERPHLCHSRNGTVSKWRSRDKQSLYSVEQRKYSKELYQRPDHMMKVKQKSDMKSYFKRFLLLKVKLIHCYLKIKRACDIPISGTLWWKIKSP
jgi:hypothetical protein